MTTHKLIIRTSVWSFQAMCSLVLMSIGNYVVNFTLISIASTKFCLSAASLLESLVIGVHLKVKNPQLFQKLPSGPCDPRKMRLSTIFAFLSGALNFAAQIFLLLAYSYNDQNVGIITSFLFLDTIIAGMFSRIIFNEKQSKTQLLGSAIIFAAIFGLSFTYTEIKASWTPIIFIICCATLFGIKALMVKYCSKSGLKPEACVCYSNFTDGVMGVGVLIYILVWQPADFGIDHAKDLIVAFSGGLCFGAAIILDIWATMNGKAGPVAAITNATSIILMFLAWGINHQKPPTDQILLMFLAFGGVMIAMINVGHTTRSEEKLFAFDDSFEESSQGSSRDLLADSGVVRGSSDCISMPEHVGQV